MGAATIHKVVRRLGALERYAAAVFRGSSSTCKNSNRTAMCIWSGSADRFFQNEPNISFAAWPTAPAAGMEPTVCPAFWLLLAEVAGATSWPIGFWNAALLGCVAAVPGTVPLAPLAADEPASRDQVHKFLRGHGRLLFGVTIPTL